MTSLETEGRSLNQAANLPKNPRTLVPPLAEEALEKRWVSSRKISLNTSKKEFQGGVGGGGAE
jgi:hypothetical protein